ncbi:MAG TPA: hypothetical protein VLR46_03610 [Candidatus Dormibacteraeota bacterium]|nr:hypothetical protein [Candidatus Dormibacteraeota bacterium]
MSTIQRRSGRRRMGTTIWTLLVSLAAALTLLLVMVVVVLVATSPNWLGH